MIKKSDIIVLLASLLLSIKLSATPEILIKYKNDDNSKALSQKTHDDRLSALQTLSKKTFTQRRSFSNQTYAYKSSSGLTTAELNDLLDKLNADNTIEYAELNGKLYPSLVPSDSFYTFQWTLFNSATGINAEETWDITTGSNIVVAVLDTGRLEHTDISGRYVSGYDFVSTTGNDLNGNLLDNDGTPGRDSDPTDPGDARNAGDCEFFPEARDSNWHGLSVSSVIAANSDNANGISGINWSASIMPVRVLARCGGDYPDIADAIRWSAGLSDINLPTPPTTPAKIINLSLGGPTSSCPETLQNAINDAFAAGSLIVVSAGNENSNASGFSLSNCENTLSVAASTIDGNRASYSNFGEAIDITAPAGENAPQPGTLVLGNNGRTNATTETFYDVVGTSFAAPHVSGVASLMYAVRPSISPARAARILRLTAKAFPSSSDCTPTDCGNGLLDAKTAVLFAQSDALFGTSVDTVSFTQKNTCATEDQGNITLNLQRTGTGIGDLSIKYQTVNASATNNSDFSSADESIIVWEDGDSTNKTIDIPIINDTAVETAETFNVVINEISDGGTIGNNNVTVTIQSDDNATALCSNILHAGGKFRLVTTSQTISETAGTATISVAREENNTGEVTVEYRTLAGAATAGQDFTAATGTLAWTNGDSANKTITIDITNDTDAEAKENFSVELFNNSSNTILVGSTVSTIVIESDESAGGGAQYLLLLFLLLLRKIRRSA